MWRNFHSQIFPEGVCQLWRHSASHHFSKSLHGTLKYLGNTILHSDIKPKMTQRTVDSKLKKCTQQRSILKYIIMYSSMFTCLKWKWFYRKRTFVFADFFVTLYHLFSSTAHLNVSGWWQQISFNIAHFFWKLTVPSASVSYEYFVVQLSTAGAHLKTIHPTTISMSESYNNLNKSVSNVSIQKYINFLPKHGERDSQQETWRTVCSCPVEAQSGRLGRKTTLTKRESNEKWPRVPKYACRAGHFRYFLIFSIIKNDFFAFFIKLINYFCTSPT